MRHSNLGFRRQMALLGAFLAFALPAAVRGQGVANPLRDAVVRSGGRVIVTLQSTQGGAQLRQAGDPPVTASELSSIASRLAGRYQLREHSRAPFAGMVMGDVSPDEVAALAADPNVASVEADRLWAPTDLGDGFDPSDRWAAYRKTDHAADTVPYGVTNVTAPTVWASGNRGEGVKVAAMDSGGDPNHPDLNYVGGYNAVTRTTSGWTDDISVCNGHGTHVAGTIAALDNGSGVVGVAPRASLYAIKVFENVNGSCLAYTSSQIAGLQWAVTQGIRLVNVSIGGNYSPSYDTAIQTAAAQGTYLIAATGNNGGAVLFPGSSQYAIGVAAVDGSNVRASWSDFGPETDFAAPGVGVVSTMPGGGTGSKSGTSMATPHVVGVSALILAAFPSLTYAQLYQKLRDGALDLESGGFDNNTGYGLVRAANSIGGVAPPPVPLTLSVSPGSRRASVVQGAGAPSDQGTVTLSGDNSSTTAWTATKRKSWTTFTTGSGTGSGTVAWSRNATGLAVGTYVDTITVSAAGAAGSPDVIYDTLSVTAPVISVTLAVTPVSRNVAVVQGASAPSDVATVTLAGTNSGSTTWSTTKRKSWTTLTTGSGTGSGTLAWSRDATGLAAGTYVDTLTVTAAGVATPSVVYDTLRVTAAPIPVTLAVAPGSRNVAVVQGASAPSDVATVTLAGTNSSSTTWSTTKRKSWTTLTTGTGTGSGTLAWSRNATGLAVGTYVDTLTVTATGVATPSVVYDTLRVTAAPIPVTLAVAPTSRNVSVQQGNGAPADQAAVTLAGTGSGTTVWSATKRKSWTTLTNGGGTGSGVLSWTRNATGLAVGTYVDTLTVTAAGVAVPVMVFDTLRITAVPVPVTLAVTPGARSTTVQVGGTASGDQASVVLSGDNSASTTWSATKRKSWTTLTTTAGTGSGNVTWARNASGLSAGVYVDTITVVAAGVATPATVFDTLRVTNAPVPLTLAVAPGSRNVAVQQGSSAPADQANITLNGDNSTTTSWTATKRKSWTNLTNASGVGSGPLWWSRNATGLAVGIYVDTITVTAAGVATPSVVYDTLRITAVPVPLTLAVTPGSRSAAVQVGGSAPGDQASVALAGDNSTTATWSATKRKSWTTLTAASGTGNGTVTWSRSASGLAVGTYVDTITVTAAGVATPSMVYDTLRVTAAPVPVTLAVAPTSRNVAVQSGSSAPADQAAVSLSGDNSSTTLWSAAKLKSWTTLTTSSGTGSGVVAWSRNATGLAVGTYVDTITVTAAGVATPVRIFDTLRVTSAPIPVTLAVSPAARSISIQQGSGAPADQATVTLAGTGSSTTTWSATKRKSWTTFTNGNGTGNGTLSWNRSTAGLAVGMYVDTITVTASGVATPATVFDTIRVTAVPVIPITVALSPAGRRVSIGQGEVADNDSASVTLSGTGSATTGWSATRTAGWASLSTASGTGNGRVRWIRNTSALAVGTYIDTIRVFAGSASAVLYDTVSVAPVSSTIAVKPKGRKSRVLTAAGSSASLVESNLDSAVVEGSVPQGESNLWLATTRSSRFRMVTQSGELNARMVWERLPGTLSPGMHIDSIEIRLQRDPSMVSVYVDTLEVVAVPSPEPGIAVEELFRAGSMSDDQRVVLDRGGNRNGSYDLGDFLAWVDRNNIRLSVETASRLQGLMLKEAPTSGTARSVRRR